MSASYCTWPWQPSYSSPVGVMLGYFGVILGLFRSFVGAMFGYFKAMLGLCWGYVAAMFGVCLYMIGDFCGK